MTDKTEEAPARSALKLALEALKQIDEAMPFPVAKLAQQVIREALAEESSGTEQTAPKWQGVRFDSALHDQPAQPQQEPVAYIHRQGNHWEVSERILLDDEKARGWTEEPLYTSPPAQRKPWVGLTDEEVMVIAFDFDVPSLVVRTVEAKLKEKNSD